MRRRRGFEAESERGATVIAGERLSWIAASGIGGTSLSGDIKAIGDKVRVLLATYCWAAAAHLVAGITLLLEIDPRRSILPALALFVALLAIDAIVLIAPHIGVVRRWKPIPLARIITVFGFALGLCWGGLALTFAFEARTGADVLALAALGSAVALTACVLAPVPAATFAFLAPMLLVTALRLPAPAPIALCMGMALLLAAAMLTGSRRAHLAARGRMQADWSAQKASLLLAEFEESRRGWFWETDEKGNLTYISGQLAEAIQEPVEALIGAPFNDLVQSDDESGARTLGFNLSTRLAFTDVAVRAAVEGEPRWWSLSGRPAFDDFGQFLGFRGSGTDLTEMRRSEAEINRLARYDALTGLPNRLLMHQTLEASIREVAEARGGQNKQCALFLLDLDRFKNVNDTLGHPVGDALLRQVAERLTRVIGEKGRCGRLGGDEFNVVVPAPGDRATLAQLADAVIERISAPYMIEGSTISIGASIGIAIAPQDAATADSLVRNADLALYAAKAAGKGVHRFYEQEMHANAKDRRLLEIDLRKVLGEGGLELVYQPVVDATSERISGFEALARWNHPTRGLVSPSYFIPIAEEIGLIPQIGEWVIRTACMEAAKWPEDVRVAVNISPIQFANPSLPSIVMNALGAAQLPAQRLELEITEGVFLNDGAATDAMFAQLKAIGVRFALDDFGTGYSSLGYLKKAPFNKIKIDQSFVRGAAIAGNRNAAIIKAIVSLAESLEMDTTAEGAETHDELQLIRSLGCSHIQGYIFGKPMPAVEALERVRSGLPVTAEGFLSSRSPRVAVLRSAMIVYGGRSVAGRVRNLSTTGAMVETTGGFAPGGAIEIEFPDGSRHAGVVRWSQEGRFGMIFDRPFDLEQLNSVRQPLRAARG
jgi:diguanylate cyclase (GGDEF)-like protein